MKKITHCITFLLCLVLTIGAFGQASESINGTVTTTQPFLNFGRAVPNTGTYYTPTALAPGLIYDNGPIINVPPDRSRLQNTTLGMNILGFGAQTTANNRMADDVTLTDDYNITEFRFYTYQTGSTTTSTITGITLRIWDGIPGVVGSNIIWGDATTNVLASTTWSNVYRDSETTVATNRPIMEVTVAPVGLTLNAGTYWLDWNYSGTLGSGPWAPPIAILGQANTGNALQSLAGGPYNPALDTTPGTNEPQGLPFQVYGESLGGGPVAECDGGVPRLIPASGSGSAVCDFPTLAPATVSSTGIVGSGAGEYELESIEIELTHSWANDLDIFLVSPGGAVTVELSTDNGGNTGLDSPATLVFTDSSVNAITGWTGGVPAANYLAEGGNLNSLLAGLSINGDWTLRICDDAAGDSGTLFSYCINFIENSIVVGNPPTIVCPADIVINNTAGTCGAVANFAGVAFDDEDGNISSSIIATPASGSTFPVGDTTVELSVTDSDGNTSTCEFNVTVLDNEAPIAVCQDITVDLDPATGSVNISGADIDNGSTDNCGIASMTLDVSTFDCSMTGANTVTLTVTDNAGNTATCTATVTVQDVTAPEIVCIGGVGTFTETEDFEGASVPAGWSTNIVLGSADWTFGSGDMPTGGDFPTNAAIFDDDAIGSEDNIAELLSPVYDLTGATSAEMSFDYALQDFVGLGLLRGEVWDGSAWQQIFLADNADVNPTNTGAIDVLAYANANFQVKFTWDDETGWNWGAGVDNFLLTYEAGSGGGLDVYLDANGMASVDPNDLLINVNEACGYTVTAGGAGGGTVGSLATLFASGNNGSPGGAVYFDVTVGPNDLEVAEIDINTADPGSFTLDVYTLVGTYVGNESNPGAWTLATSGTGTGAGIDMPSNAVLAAPITLTANTTYGMALVLDSGHSHYYTNGDGTNQNYSNADMAMALGAASNTPFTTPIFAPRIFNGVIHYTTGGGSGGLDFTCADLGENIVEVTVTDDSGNVSTCFATVNVIDNIAPILVCQDTTIELGPDGSATVDPMALLASMPTTYEVMVIGSDNSSGTEGLTDFTVNVTEAAAITFDWDYTSNDSPGFDSFGYLLNGTYTQLTDPALGNQSGSAAVAVSPGDVFGFRSQTDDNSFGNNETVISNFMPGFEGQFDPANWNLTLSNSDGTAFFTEIPGGPLSFDACGITVLAVDVTTVSCADIGAPITVTVFASDASGNIASCTSIITVVDLLGPELTCPADQTVDPGAGNLFYILPDYFATGEAIADDNCTDPVTITTQDPAPGTPLSDGTYTISFSATDEYGNTSTCDFELIVETTIGVAENSLDKGLALYPNPADNMVNLVNKTNISLEKMMIYDINGKLVSQTDLRSMQGEKAVDVSTLASGVYMVQIISDSANTVKRLIKE
ncbi:HYR domain-containing protein [Aequorivita sp. SDUM287046]|uniref:HYR domain-containing protein n=1 Tax=Aequorivita aurantiaca TaxID=3053356 RepID=A0ABT8DN06_9FLAO|nr:HYR domain-containing protein [Aequorivita aurantiaca]MDN3725361.1 HYR domain-containing protein [Aequorivita aurantiaca]